MPYPNGGYIGAGYIVTGVAVVLGVIGLIGWGIWSLF